VGILISSVGLVLTDSPNNSMAEPRTLKDFIRKNDGGQQFALKALEDYLFTRLGMMNNMWSSFEMATQTIEKLLKSYILFTDSTLGGVPDNVRKAVSDQAKMRGRRQERGHDVEAALDLAERHGMPCSVDLRPRVERINAYYAGRYPNGGKPLPLDTKEISDVDEAVFEIWDAFKSINADYYYVHGIMNPVYTDRHIKRHVNHFGQDPVYATVEQAFDILTLRNKPYEARQSELESAIAERLDAWFPSK
jgi:hypothetical protein